MINPVTLLFRMIRTVVLGMLLLSHLTAAGPAAFAACMAVNFGVSGALWGSTIGAATVPVAGPYLAWVGTNTAGWAFTEGIAICGSFLAAPTL
jgi:hypothetical protein